MRSFSLAMVWSLASLSLPDAKITSAQPVTAGDPTFGALSSTNIKILRKSRITSTRRLLAVYGIGDRSGVQCGLA
jgi:hypothetical protein